MVDAQGPSFFFFLFYGLLFQHRVINLPSSTVSVPRGLIHLRLGLKRKGKSREWKKLNNLRWEEERDETVKSTARRLIPTVQSLHGVLERNSAMRIDSFYHNFLSKFMTKATLYFSLKKKTCFTQRTILWTNNGIDVNFLSIAWLYSEI